MAMASDKVVSPFCQAGSLCILILFVLSEGWGTEHVHFGLSVTLAALQGVVTAIFWQSGLLERARRHMLFSAMLAQISLLFKSVFRNEKSNSETMKLQHQKLLPRRPGHQEPPSASS
jgi:hypothetical protein